MFPSGAGKITYQGYDIADLRLFSVFISDSSVMRVICERDVVAAIVDVHSRSIAIAAAAADVVAAMVDVSSRRISTLDVDAVVVAIVVTSSRVTAPTAILIVAPQVPIDASVVSL